jgi:hypothetical protein
MVPRRHLAAWAAATAAAVLLPFAPVVAGAGTFVHRDTYRLYAPVRTLVVDALRSGRLPLWNPYVGTGGPLFAEGIHGVLHPVSLAGAALAPSSVDFLVLAYLVAAALGAFALARTLGARPVACAAAGLAYALSGYSISSTSNLVFLAGVASLPWIAAAARSAGLGGRFSAPLTALATACGFLSGDVQATLVGVLLGLALAAQAGGRRGALRAAAGVVAGTLLAGVQIAATHELVPLTWRGSGIPDEEKVKWALAPGRLLEAVLPGLFRGPLAAWPRGASGALLDDPFADSVYLGAPLLLAAALGAARGSRRGAGLVLAVAAAVLAWLALGHHLGARQLLDGVPVWGQFRYAEKLVAPLGLCLAALGALGIEAFAARPLGRAAVAALLAGAGLAAAALLALGLAPAATTALALQLLGDPGAFLRANCLAALPHLLVALAALLAADRLRAEPARATALALLVALAPALAVDRAAFLGPPDVEGAGVARALQGEVPTARIAQPIGFPDADDGRTGAYRALERAQAALLTPSLNVAARVDTIEPYGAFNSTRLWSLAGGCGPARWARAFRRFGLTHVALHAAIDVTQVEARTLATEGATLVERDEARGTELWAVPHRPWAFFAGSAMSIERPEYALRSVLALVERGSDDTVVVETGDPVATARGRVLRIAREAERVTVEAESAGPALLVVQDAFWPGWRASLDGLPTELLAVDHLVRGIRWPPGPHRLEMSYDPPGVRRGWWLSALGAALVALLTALSVLAPRRAGPPLVGSSPVRTS